MKLRSLDQFSSSVSDCVSWRKHELKNLQSFFKEAKSPLIPLVKGTMLLTYAHWEGGIKDMAYRYLKHVEQQKRIRRDLTSNFLALESISSVKQAALSSDVLPYQQVVDHMRYNLDHRYRLPNIELIDTESNLSSKVLRKVLGCIGLLSDYEFFEQKQRFIDVAVLKTRNDIAHTGQTPDREELDIGPVIGEVLNLLENFKTCIENAAATKKYLENV